MGDRPVCVLRGHGVTTTGVSVEQAVHATRARFARSCGIGRRSLGGSVDALPAADLESLPDLGPGFNDAHLFRHLEARLEAAGLALDDSSGPMGGEPMSDVTTIAAHIARGMVPAHVYSDPDVFELERERIFGRTWLFLAHESEIPDRRRLRRAADRRRLVHRVRDERGDGPRACSTCASTAACRCAAPSRATPPISGVRTTVDVPQRRAARRPAVPRGRIRRRTGDSAGRERAARRRRRSTRQRSGLRQPRP